MATMVGFKSLGIPLEHHPWRAQNRRQLYVFRENRVRREAELETVWPDGFRAQLHGWRVCKNLQFIANFHIFTWNNCSNRLLPRAWMYSEKHLQRIAEGSVRRCIVCFVAYWNGCACSLGLSCVRLVNVNAADASKCPTYPYTAYF